MADIKTTYFLDRRSFQFLRDQITISLYNDEKRVEVDDHGTIYAMTISDVNLVVRKSNDDKIIGEHIEFAELMFLPGNLTKSEYGELKFIVEKYFLKTWQMPKMPVLTPVRPDARGEIPLEKVVSDMDLPKSMPDNTSIDLVTA